MVVRVRTYWKGELKDSYLRRLYPWEMLWWRVRRAKYGQIEFRGVGPIVTTLTEELWS